MSAQPQDPPHPRVTAIPRTINAIGAALSREKHARFHDEVMAADAGDPITPS
ncbi:hypothetical protein ACFYT4_31735 [Streptomyces sp. NPDC004609]|uniref:hypothetical protein n=1 Tax=Streptomyces sp. NPDC004609 TaxID=3364704 RepID=UPI0036A0938F